MTPAPLQPPIVTGIDGSYVTPLLVLIGSLVLAHGDAAGALSMIVLHEDLSAESRDRIHRHAARRELRVEFRAVGSRRHSFPVAGWVSGAVYLRLEIGDALTEVSRALYIDADTIVLRDLRPLLGADLRVAPIAAVRDPQNPVLGLGIALPGWSELGLPGDREYFNSGVMLIDLDRCRERGIFERAREFLTAHPESARFWDQDALNWAIGDYWHRLARRWNTFALTPLIGRGDFVHYAESVMPLADLVADEPLASVLHFAGPDKPWADGYPRGPALDLYRGYQHSISEGAH